MPTTTVSELIDRAKAAADMRDNFVTPTQWERWATQERYALDLFLARSGWPLPLSTYNFTVGEFLPGVDDDSDGNIELTADGVYTLDGARVMAIVAVHQVRNDSYRLLRHQNAADFRPSSRTQGGAMEYRVTWSGDNVGIALWPEPRNGDTYMVTYVEHPAPLLITVPEEDLVSQASVRYPMGWEERIVLGMARRALIKEESSTQAIDSEVALWESRIEEAAWGRVLADTPAVRNTDLTTYGWVDRYSYPPYGLWTFV